MATAGRLTHLKILAISMAAVITVVAIGIMARPNIVANLAQRNADLKRLQSNPVYHRAQEF
jgi:hypothetical protein